MARKIPKDEEPQPPGHRSVRMEDLCGHRRPSEVIRRALGRGALSPSLLITGPSGVGKATLARMIAASLLCDAPTPSACGACLPCRKVERGIHPDLRTIGLEPGESGKLRKEIVVEQVRTGILAPLALPPYEGRRLVFVVDPADALNPPCQNILLKPLEEPPPYAQFLLVSSSPWGLLPTVRSRCQRIGLAPISEGEMAEWARRRGFPESAQRGPALAWASGRPGRLATYEPEAFRRRRRDLLDLIEKGQDAQCALRLLKGIEGHSKEPLPDLLADLSGLLVDAARELEGLSPRFHSDASEELGAAARARGRSGISRLADRLSEAPSYLDHNVNPRLLLEWIFLAS